VIQENRIEIPERVENPARVGRVREAEHTARLQPEA